MRTDRCIAGAVLVAVFALATVRVGSILAQPACAQIPTAAERLACYDRESPPPEAARATTDAPSTSSAASAGEPAETAIVAAPSAAAASVAEEDRSRVVPVVVVGMRKYPGRSATFTTDNGDVWLQIGAEAVYLPKVPFKAELRPAAMGTYFLRPNDYGWRVHVRRND